jgi:hypothetical protein
MKSLVKKLGILASAFALGIGSLAGIARKTNWLDREIDVELKDGKITIPVYNPVKLIPGSCSGYARRAAEHIFGKKFSVSDAWDRKYKDRTIGQIEANDELIKLEKEGILKPGMIVGVFYPKSSYNDELDMEGKKVSYTHNLVYLGTGKKGELIFAEQFRTRTGTRTLAEFTDDGFLACEIFDEKSRISVQ